MKFSIKTKLLVVTLSFSGLVLMTSTGYSASTVQTVDAGIPNYTKTSGIAGNLSSAGSDTEANLMTLWAEEFRRLYPTVNLQIQAAGSSTAPPALTEGTVNLGAMSREMKDDELEAFEDKYGYKPTAIPVAIDVLAVMVSKDNPIKGLTLPQVDAIFSSTLNCGYAKDIQTWGDAGVTAWGLKPIQLYGRNSVSGTYGYFKEHALCKGDFKTNVNEQPASASVVQAVTTSRNGIGYSGMGYRTSGVRMVPLAQKEGSPFITATPENALNGTYPLTRYLYIYVNKKPNQPLPPLENEFIKLVLSKEGQLVVIKDGYIPLPAQVIEKTWGTLK